MSISRTLVNLSLLAGMLMAAVSTAGLLLPGVYAKEHVSWAAQGFGQDIINLVLALPLLMVSVYFIRKGSARAVFLWLGVLVYMSYSYVLYAFFMHFGSWFLVYVAVLGLSFYALIGGIIQVAAQISGELSSSRKGPSIYLLVNGLAFGFLWLLEIVPRMMDGQVPPSAREVGLWLNPVHVLDLALILPAMIIAALLLWRRRSMGYVLAVPVMIFAVIMAIAIVSMIFVMKERGLVDTFGPALLMALNAGAGVYFVQDFLRRMRSV